MYIVGPQSQHPAHLGHVGHIPTTLPSLVKPLAKRTNCIRMLSAYGNYCTLPFYTCRVLERLEVCNVVDYWCVGLLVYWVFGVVLVWGRKKNRL